MTVSACGICAHLDMLNVSPVGIFGQWNILDVVAFGPSGPDTDNVSVVYTFGLLENGRVSGVDIGIPSKMLLIFTSSAFWKVAVCIGCPHVDSIETVAYLGISDLLESGRLLSTVGKRGRTAFAIRPLLK